MDYQDEFEWLRHGNVSKELAWNPECADGTSLAFDKDNGKKSGNVVVPRAENGRRIRPKIIFPDDEWSRLALITGHPRSMQGPCPLVCSCNDEEEDSEWRRPAVANTLVNRGL